MLKDTVTTHQKALKMNRKRNYTDHLWDHVFEISPNKGLVFIILTATLVLIAVNVGPMLGRRVFHEFNLPVVYKSATDNAIVDVKIGGKSVPEKDWDSVLKGRYEPVWVK